MRLPAPPPPEEPALAYRVTGALNRLLWRLPLPRRVLDRLSTLLYRNPPMEEDRVLWVLDVLQRSGVSYWVTGGWGIDALAGRRTRVHRDLDLLIDEQHMDRAQEVLRGLGYWEWYRVDSDVPLFSRVVLHDREPAGHAVDLHPLDPSSGRVSFTGGRIDGRAVPCISLTSQLSAHFGYKRRLIDRADVRRLRRLIDCSVTALVVPVRAADALVDRSAREPGMPAHITLIYPFLPGRTIGEEVELELAALVRAVPRFDFALSSVGRFPGVVYLAPEPVGPFVELTEAFAVRWPERPPYGGAYEQIVPHLTVANFDVAYPGLSERLPVPARAEEVWLMVRIAARWVRRARFPLGPASTSEADSKLHTATL
jgi:2'-5' RNA ligase